MGYKYFMTSEAIKFILTALGGATAGAMIAGAFALLNAWRTSVRETAKWHREQKLDAYIDFLGYVQNFISAFSHIDRPSSDVAEVIEASKGLKNERLLIVAPTAVRVAQRDLGVAISQARKLLMTAPLEASTLGAMNRRLRLSRDAYLVAVQKDLKLDVGTWDGDMSEPAAAESISATAR